MMLTGLPRWMVNVYQEVCAMSGLIIIIAIDRYRGKYISPDYKQINTQYSA